MYCQKTTWMKQMRICFCCASVSFFLFLEPSALLLRLHTASYSFHPSCYPYLVRGKRTFNNVISRRLWGGIGSETEETSEHARGQRHGIARWDRLEGTAEGPASLLQQGHPGAHGTGPHPPPMTLHHTAGEKHVQEPEARSASGYR